ncbi:MAG: anthranilate synthase component I [Spirochaetaceae bacterium]|nr:MAG: anthranilate synthase component I [Spirochaetaceae bacterium]
MAHRSDGIIKILPGERYTPYALAKKLQAAAILESSSYQKGRERYSILMVDEAFRIEQRADRVLMIADGKRYRIKGAGRDILEVLRYFADQHTPPHQDFPFPSGGIGYLSYEFAARCDSISFRAKADPLQLPDAAFIFGHVFLIFDHYTDLLYLIGLNYKQHQVDLQRAVADVERRITDLNFNYLQDETVDYPVSIEAEHAEREQFLSGVESVKREIIAGNLLQGVLSRRLRISTAMPAIEAYRRLRTANPSPYLFYVDFGSYQIFGSSPEVHVKVRDGEVRMRPIAGTRRRGADRAEDQRLEAELLADPKERAEHLMLVDLARNDLGRVCEAGSVVVHKYMTVQRFSHVMHIVSQVRGQLSSGRSGEDAVRATFPAGTVSGAPKIRAIEVIDALEREPRRFYAGLVGYLEPGGNLDTCITIRSALKQGATLVLQAGAGVVYDSVPEREYEETGEKLRALAHAVGVEV